MLIVYWDEHGSNAIDYATIATSIRQFIGFLLQDLAGANATAADMVPAVFERFRRWRMGPHSYSVPWAGKQYNHDSPGVRGESVQRNLDDIKAAFNHAANNGRLNYAPKVPSVKTELRSPARDVRVSVETLGAMLAFTRSHPEMHRWISLMIATACRPDAALAFDPALQDRGNLLDLHPLHWPRTKKRNPIVPVIAPLRTLLDDWKAKPHGKAASRKKAWRTMRRALELPSNIVPKVIRHTVATELRGRGVPADDVSGLLGHLGGMHSTTAVYAKYDPAFLKKAKAALTAIFNEATLAAEQWSADHTRTKTGNGLTLVLEIVH